jgi:DNA gyrase subunit B
MSENSSDQSATSETQIPRLTWPDFVRKRPGMYFGSMDSYSLHEMFWQTIDYPIFEASNGLCNRIELVLYDSNVVSITDNGAGLPFEIDLDTQRPILDTVNPGILGQIHIQPYHFHASHYPLTMFIAHAVCTEFIVQVKRHGFLWQQTYQEGLQTTDFDRIRPLLSGESTGTTITYKPDFSIFDPGEFNFKEISQRLQELAFLIPGLLITFEDKRMVSNRRVEFFSQAGVSEYVRYLNRDYQILNDPIVIRKNVPLKRKYEPLGYSGTFDIAIQFANTQQPVILGFMNGNEVEHGGTHIYGMMESLSRTIGEYAKNIELIEGNSYYFFITDDISCGLTAVLSIRHPEPQFEGSARYRLMNSELEGTVYSLIRDALEAFAEANPDQMRRIVEKCIANKQLRLRRRYGE